MKLFTKKEWIAVFIILALVAVASFFNFRTSLMRARDAQRVADLGTLVDALNTYAGDFGFYPQASSDGEIVACKKEGAKVFKGMKIKDFLAALAPCEWGKDSLSDITDATFPAYLKNLPKDPKSATGYSFRYLSNGSRFQLYTALETSDSDEFRPDIVKRTLACGNKICSAGRASGATPLDRSIDQYEQELLQKQKSM